MTMDVEFSQPVGDDAEHINADQIMDYLTNSPNICFKSQQRGEDDLTKQQKTDIALDLYTKSKTNFLVRFGKYLQQNQLEFFEQFSEDDEEIDIMLKDLLSKVKKSDQVNVKNRRYEALKQMIGEDKYFSEVEMMKRNPLLYEQLVGQYLTEDEKVERDKIKIDGDATLVKVLMEGIERDNAKIKKDEQEQIEIEMMDEDEEDVEDDSDSDGFSGSQATYSQWGEFTEDTKKIKIKKRTKHITVEEQKLLKEEFVSSMYQNFLDGKDEDFDYASVDNNDKYDNSELIECDEEDKYFDSEEPDDNPIGEMVESEDELDIFMSALNQNPAVSQLSKDIENL